MYSVMKVLATIEYWNVTKCCWIFIIYNLCQNNNSKIAIISFPAWCSVLMKQCNELPVAHMLCHSKEYLLLWDFPSLSYR